MSIAGAYYDPKHGACLRTISYVKDNIWLIQGYYGDDELEAPGTPWQAHVYQMIVHDQPAYSNFLTVDFFEKKTNHSRLYNALWCPSVREIHWEDGNVWKRLYSTMDQSYS